MGTKLLSLPIRKVYQLARPRLKISKRKSKFWQKIWVYKCKPSSLPKMMSTENLGQRCGNYLQITTKAKLI